jgi:hypothetical protein
MYRWYDCGNGRKVYRKAPEQHGERSKLPTPMLVRPFTEPLQSMADGKYYDTPRDLERTYRAGGNPFGQEFIPLGNETMKTVEYTPDPKERRNHVREAMNDVLTGNLPPEIAAIP